jgi:hypothetical protein
MMAAGYLCSRHLREEERGVMRAAMMRVIRLKTAVLTIQTHW